MDTKIDSPQGHVLIFLKGSVGVALDFLSELASWAQGIFYLFTELKNGKEQPHASSRARC